MRRLYIVPENILFFCDMTGRNLGVGPEAPVSRLAGCVTESVISVGKPEFRLETVTLILAWSTSTAWAL